MGIGAQSLSPHWNQFDPCALEGTEPSARFYAEPGTMWTTLFTVSFWSSPPPWPCGVVLNLSRRALKTSNDAAVGAIKAGGGW